MKLEEKKKETAPFFSAIGYPALATTLNTHTHTHTHTHSHARFRGVACAPVADSIKTQAHTESQPLPHAAVCPFTEFILRFTGKHKLKGETERFFWSVFSLTSPPPYGLQLTMAQL